MPGMGRVFLVGALVAALGAALGAACSSSKPGGGDHDTVAGKPGDPPHQAGGATPFTTARDAFAAAARAAMGGSAKLTVSPAAENVVNSLATYNLGDLRAFQGDSGSDVIRGWASSDGKAVVVWGGQPHGDLGVVGKAAGLLDPSGKPTADVAAALVWAQGLGWEPADPPVAAITRKDSGAELTFVAVQMQMGGPTRRMNGSFRCDARYTCTLALSPAP